MIKISEKLWVSSDQKPYFPLSIWGQHSHVQVCFTSHITALADEGMGYHLGLTVITFRGSVHLFLRHWNVWSPFSVGKWWSTTLLRETPCWHPIGANCMAGTRTRIHPRVEPDVLRSVNHRVRGNTTTSKANGIRTGWQTLSFRHRDAGGTIEHQVKIHCTGFTGKFVGYEPKSGFTK